jgi:hypothetical protein
MAKDLRILLAQPITCKAKFPLLAWRAFGSSPGGAFPFNVHVHNFTQISLHDSAPLVFRTVSHVDASFHGIQVSLHPSIAFDRSRLAQVMLCRSSCSILLLLSKPTSRRRERCIFQKDSTLRASLTHHRSLVYNFELVHPNLTEPRTRLMPGSGPLLMMLPLTFLLPTILLD